MPTSSMMYLPKTKSPEEFENICQDVLSKIIELPVDIYGSKGQAQHGIDLIATKLDGGTIVAQCKNYLMLRRFALIKAIKEDIQAAVAVKNVGTFFVMTASDRDNFVINKLHEIKCEFNLRMLFWQDIEKVLCDYPELWKKHYPTLNPDDNLTIAARNELIAQLNVLRRGAQCFYKNLSRYRVGYHEDQDTEVFNLCLSMAQATQSMMVIEAKYHMQLMKMYIAKKMESISENMPPIYVEDGTGGGIVMTVSGYQSFFRSNLNHMFLEDIKKVIEILEADS